MEINQEALKSMSIADLSATIHLLKMYLGVNPNSLQIISMLERELNERLGNVFIF